MQHSCTSTQLHASTACSSKMATTKFNKCTCRLWLSQTDLLSQCQPFSSTSNHRTYAEGRIPKTYVQRVFLRIRAFPKFLEAMKKKLGCFRNFGNGGNICINTHIPRNSENVFKNSKIYENDENIFPNSKIQQ